VALNQEKNTLLNYIMLVDRPAVSLKGEDAYAYSFADGYGMMGVFDGCGGLGARKYENFHDATGAYIAARVVSASTLDWFEQKLPCDQTGMYRDDQKIAAALKDFLDDRLALTREKLENGVSMLRGGMIRSFPTTMSAAIMDYSDAQKIRCLFLWAGDSRGYILRPEGLVQCTKDDLRIEEDPFENLYADSPLSNMINAEKEYRINSRRFSCAAPAIVITATDGTFGYLPSPMHYEYMLLDTLSQARSLEDWEKLLHEAIGRVTADDSTLMMAVYGFKSFKMLKQAFEPRFAALGEMLRGDNTVEEMRAIWQKYAKNYYPQKAKAPSDGQ